MKVFADGQLLPQAPAQPIQGPAILLAAPDERDAALALASINTSEDMPDETSKSIRFEARRGYDYLIVRVPDFWKLDAEPIQIEAYAAQQHLVVVGRDGVMDLLEKDLTGEACEDKSPARALSLLFTHILSRDAGLMEQIEDRVEELEERAVRRKPEDHTGALIVLRKQLMALKRYYEALYDLLEDLEENLNGFFSKHQLQSFRLQKNRADRFLNAVVNLRDYLTQVREAFQNQLDISLNETMRFFTVITAVFLPPTLIVGWYGMNLVMPETAYPITYPIVGVACLAIVVLMLWYSKRKGWF